MLIIGSMRCAASGGMHSFSHSSVQKLLHVKQSAVPLSQLVRGFARDARFARPVLKTATTKAPPKSRTWKEILMQPATQTPHVAGKMFLAGCSGLGLAGLCYYGLGMSSEAGTFDKMGLWPQYVRDRVHTTYAYFGGSLGLTAAAAVMVSRTPALMNLVSRGGMMALVGTIVAMIGTGAVCRGIEYSGNGPSIKHVAWMVHCGVLGAVVAPLTLLGGPVMMSAAWYTAAIVGGMSIVAMCAPSEKFLNMGGVLGMGLGVVFLSSIGTWFLPPTTAIGAGLYSIAMYGGLALFSAFLLYDTQRIVKMAEAYPPNALKPYDPINACLSIYLDTMNIFIRMAMLMAGGGRKR